MVIVASLMKIEHLANFCNNNSYQKSLNLKIFKKNLKKIQKILLLIKKWKNNNNNNQILKKVKGSLKQIIFIIIKILIHLFIFVKKKRI